MKERRTVTLSSTRAKEISRVHSLVLIVLLIASCGRSGSPPPAANDYTAFGSPQRVTISGYSSDAMEPFISRDGNYLFFNDNTVGSPEKDLYYASLATGTTAQYQGAVTAINSAFVDGVPTMDLANNFYYVSLVNYDAAANFDTLYAGTWNGSAVTGSVPVTGLTITAPLIIYFDIEVSPDGSTLYISRGDFNNMTGGFPDPADIVIAVRSGSAFALDPNSAGILANVNTADKLEYAPAVSADGLELFFTRLDPNTVQARIYRAVRPDTSAAFGIPQLVSAITGFVEGPAFSPDEKSLYYHRLNTGNGRFEIYRVARP